MRPLLPLIAFAAILLSPMHAQNAAGSGVPAVPAAPPPDSDAAKHIRRTACIKEARTRKLVGEPRDTFIKSCVAGH